MDRWTENLTALETTPDIIVRIERSTGRLLAINRSELLGWTRAELLATRAEQVVPGLTPALMEAAIRQEHDPHPLAPLRLVFQSRDAQEVPVDIRAGAETDQTAWLVIRPVSEKARIDERELVTVICSAPDAIITWKPDGKIVSWNPGAEKLYGLHASSAIGQSISQLIPDSERAEFERVQAELLEGAPVRIREVTRTAHGQEVRVEEALFVIRDHGPHPRRLGSFSRDMAELARLRQATRILAKTERDAAVPVQAGLRMRQTYASAEVAVQNADATVLLLGETGVGKSRLARWIHSRGARAERPFLELNCATLEGALMESELFGHERGAFTGAQAQKRGLVEVAEGGTLFLDEIGELPLSTQAKLLAFLDDRKFRRVGGTRALTANVRVVAATHVDLERAVEGGQFRKDLFYRLKVLPIEIPPLRERGDEMQSLVQDILRELRGRMAPKVSVGAMKVLRAYAWPGNLRELRNILERTTLQFPSETLERDHLPIEIRERSTLDTSDQTLAAVERRHILSVLAATGGNRSRTAELLGIDRSTLRRKLAETGEESANDAT